MTATHFDHVLIIDDDPIQREFVANHMRMRGAANIHFAADGLQAQQQIAAHGGKLDLILSDLNMPEFDGIEFLMYLNGLKLKAALIFVSGASQAILKAADKLASVYDVNYGGILRKPLNFEALDQLLSTAPRRT